MRTFSQLQKNLKKDFSGLQLVKIALLGDSTTSFLAQALRGAAFDRGFNLELFEAGFNQIERQVFDPGSDLYLFKPQIIILFQASHKLLQKYNKLNAEDCKKLSSFQLKELEDIHDAITQRLNANIIYYNFAEIDDAVFGNHANKTESSFLFQLRKINFALMEFATSHSNFYVCDLSSIQNFMGRNQIFKPSLYIISEMVLSVDALPEVAVKTIDLIAATQGKFKKCLVVDLDNTLWGGVIGDDGIENIQIGNLGIGKAFTEFQYWIKKLKNRGIIICVCSKNDESIAKEPFEKHPDMVLHLEDIAVFQVNWENKVDNLFSIQRILNIGFDSMVFLDDNPFERNMVRENIQEITVPELPEDPAEYLEYLYPLNLFETVSFSQDDTDRTRQYQTEAKRTLLEKNFTHENEFLESLHMRSLAEPFTKFNIPRVAQLIQRSNQFNLRTVRYTESEIELISTSSDFFTFTFTLEDKFGDSGLISVLILKKENQHTLFIDTWLMSCRVLKRGVENFVLNEIVATAREFDFKAILGEYIPTAKNALVKTHYDTLGFKKKDQFFSLDVEGFKNLDNYIIKR
jgi:FkbH-like protein